MRTTIPISCLALALASCSGSREAVKEPVNVTPVEVKAEPRRAFPETRRDALLETLFGQQVADPYRWLEDEKAPEVQEWMRLQDKAARDWFDARAGRDALEKRFRELFYLDSISVPHKRGGRLFYTRTHADKEKAIVYWRQGADGEEKVLLDPNQWSEDGTVSLGIWTPSWDGKKVAYAVRPNAADEATLHVIDVDSGEVSKIDVIEGAKYASPSWTPDAKGFYYEYLPADPSIPVSERPGYTELRFHALGTDPKQDPVIHPKTGNPSSFLGGGVSRDGRWLLVYIQRGWNENDVYLRDLKKKGDTFRPLVLGKDATYEVNVWTDQLYVVTNEGASNKRVFKVAATKPERASWKEIVPEDPEATLEAMTIVGGHLALLYMKNAANELRIATLDGKPVRTIALPGIGSTSPIYGLQDDEEAYYSFSSFTVPRQVYKLSMKTGATELWSEVKLPIDPSPYEVEQVWFPSKDGTKVSMFVVRRKDMPRDGSNPTLLYGYGGFNVSMTPWFSSSIYPWLEAGGVYAVPNLRGGGEYGKRWHDAGKGANKQNVFDDYVAAAEWLIANGYTSPKKLAIYGGSNGGLLVGAAMTQRPELYGAVVCAVPLLDMVRYHLFGSGRTWIPEYGTAEIEDEFKTLFAYSPYHRTQKGTKYPALLMLSADHDDRVDPMHARKFVAAIQHDTVGEAPVLLRIETNAGHSGADQVRKSIAKSVDMYSFLFEQLGMTAKTE
ncbi:MAG: prolyl oligopeptidase family serine peptidase [Myxococcales bacterium]|jgi:prolyl oligopeptidase